MLYTISSLTYCHRNLFLKLALSKINIKGIKMLMDLYNLIYKNEKIIGINILKLTEDEQIIIQDTLNYSLDLFENQEKKMILIVVEVTKLQRLRQIVRQSDPDAFLIITEASEMLGRGN